MKLEDLTIDILRKELFLPFYTPGKTSVRYILVGDKLFDRIRGLIDQKSSFQESNIFKAGYENILMLGNPVVNLFLTEEILMQDENFDPIFYCDSYKDMKKTPFKPFGRTDIAHFFRDVSACQKENEKEKLHKKLFENAVIKIGKLLEVLQ